MPYYYFPSCNATAQYREASIRARTYVKARFGIDPIGCCRPNHKKLTAEDTALVVCNNCAAIIEENTDAKLEAMTEVFNNSFNTDPSNPWLGYSRIFDSNIRPTD